MSKEKNILIGLITGTALGTLIGMLYAPDKGINTRDRLSYRLFKYRNALKDLLNQLAEGKNSHTSTAKEEGQKVIKDATVKAEQLLNDVEDLIEQIRNKRDFN